VSTRDELMNLRAEKLREEIRFEAIKNELGALELAAAQDKEADRLAKPGARGNLQLNIDGPIYGGNVESWIDILEHWERRDPGSEILLRINSPGGSIFDGFSLYDTIMRLRRKGHRVTAHGTGMVASMATVIMQAGEERVLDENASFMIHEASAQIGGKTSERRDLEKLITKLENRLVTILAERSTLTAAQVKRRIAKTDDWMDAAEALKLGFVDRVE
jgi:ATP-dependent Clp endopeptidase proteolytic subunit ClpP